jgi:hypothetical protein
MEKLDNMYLARFSLNTDYDPFFEEDFYPDIELEKEFNHFTGSSDSDEADEFFWDEN